MKRDRFGQAEPFDSESFRRVRDCFATPSHRLLFCLGWHTTERWGALLKLKTSDVYEDVQRRKPRATITIAACHRKDRQTREVPVSRALAQELRAYTPDRDPDTWLFPSLVNIGEHLTMRAAERALERALKKAGLEGRGYSTHSTRRGAITQMSRSGVAIRVIQSITGHRNLQTLSRYIEVSDVDRSRAIAVLD